MEVVCETRLDDVGTEATQDVPVLAEPTLEREHADPEAVVHDRKCRFDP